jgi:hypothetical protein
MWALRCWSLTLSKQFPIWLVKNRKIIISARLSLTKVLTLNINSKGGGHYKELPPHIYAIGAEAYRCLFENEKN